MRVTCCELEGVLLIEPDVYADSRGFFFESYNERDFERATGLRVPFVQDNHSQSRGGVLRGLHYQVRQPQGKLVRAVTGEIFDVAVDLRRSSRSYGRWAAVVLSADNRRIRWIPPGFAHGFLVLSETADTLYKATEYYAPAFERSIAWNDASLRIDWPLKRAPVLSARDANACSFAEAESFV